MHPLDIFLLHVSGSAMLMVKNEMLTRNRSKHAEFIADETRLLEEETELFKSRLRQSK
jgi:hypothetical protein